MSDLFSSNTGSDSLMEEFVNVYHETADKATVLETYCNRYPRLSDDFRDYASLLHKLAGPQPSARYRMCCRSSGGPVFGLS
jgi:hypothetical protein